MATTLFKWQLAIQSQPRSRHRAAHPFKCGCMHGRGSGYRPAASLAPVLHLCTSLCREMRRWSTETRASPRRNRLPAKGRNAGVAQIPSCTMRSVNAGSVRGCTNGNFHKVRGNVSFRPARSKCISAADPNATTQGAVKGRPRWRRRAHQKSVQSLVVAPRNRAPRRGAQRVQPGPRACVWAASDSVG